MYTDPFKNLLKFKAVKAIVAAINIFRKYCSKFMMNSRGGQNSLHPPL
jgi:hypothetical protein